MARKVELVIEGMDLTHIVDSAKVDWFTDSERSKITVRLKAEFLDPDGEAFRHLKGLRKAKAKK